MRLQERAFVLASLALALCPLGSAQSASAARPVADPAVIAVDLDGARSREEVRVGVFSPEERSVPAGREADLLLSAELAPVVSAAGARPANPDIAAGPEDLLVVAGQNRILRLPNPNTTGASLPYTAPTAANPGIPAPLTNLNAVRAAGGVSEINLDTWIGATVLNDICPGAFNPQTCLIRHPTVRYDQIHGHFLVAFAVTDTGVVGSGSSVTAGRASTWVLLISRKASFVSPSGTLPANVFTTPALPGSSLTADWYIYYGRRDSAGPGGFLNLNMYSTHPTATPLSTMGRYSATFPETNCNAPVGAQPPLSGSAPAGEETVCFFPTEVRLGIDAESIILASPVMNVNQIIPATAPSNTIPFTTGRYAGNRVRVLSKFKLYSFGTLTNGTWFVPGAYTGRVPYSGDGGASGALSSIAAPTQHQFDMFRNTDLPAFCSVFDFATDTCTTPTAGFPPRRYTLGLEVSPTGSGIDTPRPPADPTTASALYPLYYEPAHLRGRALAKYSNYPYGGYTHLLGGYALGPNAGQGGNLWVQAISYRPDYRPALDAGDQAAIGIDGPRRQLVPDTAINPLHSPQATTCSTPSCSSSGVNDPPNLLYIGEGRPQRAIYREGRLYDARGGRPASNVYGTSLDTPVANNANTANPALSATVYYDTIQTIYTSATPALPALGSTAVFTLPLTNPSLTFYGFWQNGHFYNPMFDVPANVQRSGTVSPAGAAALLDRLFVGTTSPRVAQPNPTGQGNIWPSLFDIRQGLDKYDRLDFFTDPRSGRVINPLTAANTTNLFSTRHGASTDPIRGGLWTYGAFSDSRISAAGQWATHAAYTDMTFKRLDAYDGGPNFFADVCPPGQGDFTCLDNGFFPYIQSAKQIGLTEYLYGAGGLPLVQVDQGNGTNGTAVAFQPLRRVTRAELAALVVYSVMDEDAVADYLGKTGLGLGNSFTDVAGASGSDPDGFPAIVHDDQRRAIEVLTRRGFGAGCGPTTFCPLAFASRADAAEWIIKAKLSNVHPTVVSGCSTPLTPSGPCLLGGDQFWPLLDTTPYFPGDVGTGHPQFGPIQMMRRLRITNGNGPGLYSPAELVSRQAVATFIVKAFHL